MSAHPALPRTHQGTTEWPFGTFMFEVKIPGVQIGYFAECGGLGVEYEVLEYNEGGNNEFVHLLRGRRKHSRVTLKRGITLEDGLLKWFNEVDKKQPPAMTIALLDEFGDAKRTFSLAAAVPLKWTGPNLTSESNTIATESLEIGHQGIG